MKFSKFYYSFMLLLLSATLLFAKGNKGIFYQFKSPTNTTVSLLGSVHLGDSSMYPLDKVIENAYKKADFLVVEVNINMTDEQKMALQGKILKVGMLSAGDSLPSHISKAALDTLSLRFAEVGMNCRMFYNFKPWVLVLVAAQLQMAKLGLNADYGIDNYFLKKGNKKIIELESADFQIDLLGSMDNLEIDSSIIGTESMAKMKEKLNIIKEAWKNGNSALLEKELLQDSKKSTPKFHEAMFTKRNINMAEKIDNMLKEKNKHYFIVVGAGHLIGDGSVIDLLKTKYHYSELK